MVTPAKMHIFAYPEAKVHDNFCLHIIPITWPQNGIICACYSYRKNKSRVLGFEMLVLFFEAFFFFSFQRNTQLRTSWPHLLNSKYSMASLTSITWWLFFVNNKKFDAKHLHISYSTKDTSQQYIQNIPDLHWFYMP